MSQDYRAMWAGLGLDLEAHDQLLAALGQGYQQVFLGQAGRPEGMKYFDFVMSEVHGLRIKELLDAKAAGRKVFGSFCVFVPEEIVLAANGVLVGLCAGAEFAPELAEKLLPRNICALIKGAFGFALGKVCPYLAAADAVVGENTCDGKKKSYEIFGKLVPELYVMDLPQMKSVAGRELLAAEYRRFLEYVERISGRRIDAAALRRGIALVNAKRAAVQRMAKLRAADPAPISGLDALLVNQVFFYDDPQRCTASVNKICDEIEARIRAEQGARPAGAPRLIISGCPMAVPNWKVPMLIESAGAAIVGEESCVGERGTQYLTGEQGDSVEQLLDNIVERYFKIDCAVFTPNPTRIEHVKQMVAQYCAQGVVQYNIQFCSPYQVESGPAAIELERAGIPVLTLDTDYGMGDAEALRTRIEAFIERIKQ